MFNNYVFASVVEDVHIEKKIIWTAKSVER